MNIIDQKVIHTPKSVYRWHLAYRSWQDGRMVRQVMPYRGCGRMVQPDGPRLTYSEREDTVVVIRLLGPKSPGHHIDMRGMWLELGKALGFLV